MANSTHRKPYRREPRPTSRAHSALLRISEITVVLSGLGRIDAVLAEVVRLMAGLAQIGDAMIVLIDERGRMRAMTKAGWKEYADGQDEGRLLHRVVRQILSNAMPLVLRSAPNHLMGAAETTASGKSLVAVPINGDWGPIGAVIVERDGLSSDPADQTLSEDICFLDIVACLVAQTIALRRAANGDRSPFPTPAGQASGAPNGLPAPGPARPRLVQRSKKPSPADRQRLIDAMERAGWVQAKAARLLGVTLRQMRYALRKHNIEIKRL